MSRNQEQGWDGEADVGFKYILPTAHFAFTVNAGFVGAATNGDANNMAGAAASFLYMFASPSVATYLQNRFETYRDIATIHAVSFAMATVAAIGVASLGNLQNQAAIFTPAPITAPADPAAAYTRRFEDNCIHLGGYMGSKVGVRGCFYRDNGELKFEAAPIPRPQ